MIESGVLSGWAYGLIILILGETQTRKTYGPALSCGDRLRAECREDVVVRSPRLIVHATTAVLWRCVSI